MDSHCLRGFGSRIGNYSRADCLSDSFARRPDRLSTETRLCDAEGRGPVERSASVLAARRAFRYFSVSWVYRRFAASMAKVEKIQLMKRSTFASIALLAGFWLTWAQGPPPSLQDRFLDNFVGEWRVERKFGNGR